MTKTLLPDWLHQRARLSPHRLALTLGATRLTYADLDSYAAGLTGWLMAQGVSPGGRVGLLLQNSLAFVGLVHAISRAGAVLAPFNTRLVATELSWQIRDSRIELLIADPGLLSVAQEAARDSRACRVASAADLRQQSGPRPALFDMDAVHSILYTSGTTGRPKGAVLTFGNHWWSAIGSALNLGLHEDDGWLAVMPMFHVGGLSTLLKSVIYGHPIFLLEKFDPHSVNAAIDSDGVTLVSMVSTMLQGTLEERGARPLPTRLRCILLGGGPAPRPLLELCAQREAPVVQTYGLTEAASQVATLSPEDALRKLGSAGKPLFPTELRIEGDPGEIVIRGPTLSSGYLDNPAANARAFVDGWFHTGDLGYLDEEGYLYVLDRRDDLIISGGENVYPAEIEAALREHPAVADAGVTGLADPTWGQAPAAFVVRREAVTVEELQAFLAARLARYKLPAAIRFVESLPRNAGGKLLRKALLALPAS